MDTIINPVLDFGNAAFTAFAVMVIVPIVGFMVAMAVLIFTMRWLSRRLIVRSIRAVNSPEGQKTIHSAGKIARLAYYAKWLLAGL